MPNGRYITDSNILTFFMSSSIYVMDNIYAQKKQHTRYEGPTMIALKHKRSCRLVKLMKMTLGKRYQTCRLCLLSDALLKGLKEVL